MVDILKLAQSARIENEDDLVRRIVKEMTDLQSYDNTVRAHFPYAFVGKRGNVKCDGAILATNETTPGVLYVVPRFVALAEDTEQFVRTLADSTDANVLLEVDTHVTHDFGTPIAYAPPKRTHSTPVYLF